MADPKLVVTFVPSGTVLKAIVGGWSGLEPALDIVDQIAIEASSLGLERVLIAVKLVESNLSPEQYAEMASHAAHRLQGVRCAILAPPQRRTGREQVALLSSNFRIFFDEERALAWLEAPVSLDPAPTIPPAP